MAIPGSASQEAVVPVGKVRIGEKKAGAKFPSSLNYFRANEPLFAELCGERPTSIEIVLIDTPHVEPAWSSGMEWWVAKDGKNKLACYTKDASDDPIAYRLRPYLDPDNVKRGEEIGSDRQPISCPFRDCVHFQKKQCKPIGRMTFYIASDPEKRPWRLDTKSWFSIEAIEAALKRHPVHQRFWLTVEYKTKGDKRFPVLGLELSSVQVTEENVPEADRMVALAKALDTGKAREGLAAYLDETHPGWRNNPAIIDRIKEIGPEAAIRNIFRNAHSG